MKSIYGTKYEQINKIGFGTFGNIFSVKTPDNNQFAFKKFKKQNNELDTTVLREISILKIIQNNINNFGLIKLIDIIIEDDDEQTIGIIMEKYETDLFEIISNKIKLLNNQKYNISKKILEAIAFLHKNHIIHRDIKPENILIDKNKNPVLADYSLSKVFNGLAYRGTHTSKISTPHYRAPEITHRKRYGLKSDMWSVGVVLYELYTNKILQFENELLTINYLQNQIPKFKKTSLGYMIKGLLKYIPYQRKNAIQTLKSSYFNQSHINIPQKIYNKLNKYHISSQVKKLCKQYNVQKKITKWATQIYIDKTNCNPLNALELACKFYENKIYYINSEDFGEEEILIFQKMNYNLFI